MTLQVYQGWALLLACYAAAMIGYQVYPIAALYAALSGTVITIGVARESRDRELENSAPTVLIHRER
jgi:hypothetical protein